MQTPTAKHWAQRVPLEDLDQIPPFTAQRFQAKKKRKVCRSQRSQGHQENLPTELTKQDSQGLTQTKLTIRKSVWVSARSSANTDVSIVILWESSHWEWRCLRLFPLILGTLPSYCVVSFSHEKRVCACSSKSCCAMFSWYPWEPCYFLN